MIALEIKRSNIIENIVIVMDSFRSSGALFAITKVVVETFFFAGAGFKAHFQNNDTT